MNRQILNFGKIAVLVCKFSFVVERVALFSIRIGLEKVDLKVHMLFIQGDRLGDSNSQKDL